MTGAKQLTSSHFRKWLPLLAFGALLDGGCVYTSQNIALATTMSPGMTPSQVMATMGGPPVKSDLYGNIQEWHYCKTGFGSDQFVAFFFRDGKLVESRNYSVTVEDVNGATGDCSAFIRRGTYRDPDWVAEIRRR